MAIKVENSQFDEILFIDCEQNSIPSPQTAYVSYVLIGNAEGGITETIILHPIFNSQNSIPSMRRYPKLVEELK